MNPVFEEFKKTHKPDPINKEGYIWLNMLIRFNMECPHCGKRFDLSGDSKENDAKIIRSFTKPAKESTIKNLKKDVKKFEKIDIDKEDSVKDLF